MVDFWWISGGFVVDFWVVNFGGVFRWWISEWISDGFLDVFFCDRVV